MEGLIETSNDPNRPSMRSIATPMGCFAPSFDSMAPSLRLVTVLFEASGPGSNLEATTIERFGGLFDAKRGHLSPKIYTFGQRAALKEVDRRLLERDYEAQEPITEALRAPGVATAASAMTSS